jgi:hypothetical protein
MSKREIIGYSIRPIYSDDDVGHVMTAALQQCAVTGKMISSMGGGGIAISPEVYERLMSPEGKAFFADLQEDFSRGGAAVL